MTNDKTARIVKICQKLSQVGSPTSPESYVQSNFNKTESRMPKNYPFYGVTCFLVLIARIAK